VAILKKKMKIVFLSEIVRNANENGFQTSKMATGGHLENKMARNTNENEFLTSKMAAGGHFEIIEVAF
jgi:deoxyhypusine synthase